MTKKRDTKMIKVDEIIYSPYIRTIQEEGIIQPIIVRPIGDDKYEVVSGRRRFELAQIAGLKEIPVIIRKDLDDKDLRVLQFHEACLGCDNDW
jgi:ParB family transcriptional regulator, chromosome partitioning protein